MNSLWYKLKYTVQADLQKLLDQKEQNNPIALLNQHMKDAERQTFEVEALLERQGKLKNTFQNEWAEAEKMLNKRKEQLKLAQIAEEHDLAAFAEREIKAYELRTSELADSAKATENECIELEQKLEEMKHQVKDMRLKQLQLMGKENMTRANRKIEQIISFSKTDIQKDTFTDIQTYLENLGDVKHQSTEASSMENRLDALEKDHAQTKEIV